MNVDLSILKGDRHLGDYLRNKREDARMCCTRHFWRMFLILSLSTSTLYHLSAARQIVPMRSSAITGLNLERAVSAVARFSIFDSPVHIRFNDYHERKPHTAVFTSVTGASGNTRPVGALSWKASVSDNCNGLQTTIGPMIVPDGCQVTARSPRVGKAVARACRALENGGELTAEVVITANTIKQGYVVIFNQVPARPGSMTAVYMDRGLHSCRVVPGK